MQLDELAIRFLSSAFVYLQMGESLDDAAKLAAVSSLADQTRKDVDGIPDQVVDGLEVAARGYLKAKNIVASSRIVLEVPEPSQEDIEIAKATLLDPGVGPGPEEQKQLEKSFKNRAKLLRLQNSILNRTD